MAAEEAGSGPIQLQPAQLLEFLQLKNRGRNPSTLLDGVRPVIGLDHWYFEGASRYVWGGTGGSVGDEVVGTVVLWTVPQDWWLLDYTVRTQPLPSAGTFKACVSYQPVDAPGTEYLLASPTQFFVDNTNEIWVGRAELRAPLFLRRGSRLGMIVLTNAVQNSFLAFPYIRYALANQG